MNGRPRAEASWEKQMNVKTGLKTARQIVKRIATLGEKVEKAAAGGKPEKLGAAVENLFSALGQAWDTAKVVFNDYPATPVNKDCG